MDIWEGVQNLVREPPCSCKTFWEWLVVLESLQGIFQINFRTPSPKVRELHFLLVCRRNFWEKFMCREQKKHIHFFNINFLAPTRNTPFSAPRKKFMCFISWPRMQKRGGILGSKKGPQTGIFGHKKFGLLFFSRSSCGWVIRWFCRWVRRWVAHLKRRDSGFCSAISPKSIDHFLIEEPGSEKGLSK